MKKLIAFLLLTTMLFTCFACAAADGNAQTTTADGNDAQTTAQPDDITAAPDTTAAPETTPALDAEEPLDPNKEYSVLFIGNSYTYYNVLHGMFKKIAASAGYNVNPVAVTKGSSTFEDHVDETTETGRLVANAFDKKQFDFVVIQEHSTRPFANPTKFYDGTRALVEMIRADGATPILYET